MYLIFSGKFLLTEREGGHWTTDRTLGRKFMSSLGGWHWSHRGEMHTSIPIWRMLSLSGNVGNAFLVDVFCLLTGKNDT